MLKFDQYEVLTFDCYGTLIDWETGILSVMQPFLKSHEVYLPDQKTLELYGTFESEAQKERYIIYQDILRTVIRSFGNKFSFIPSTTELNSLVNSIGKWKPFSDSVKALQVFKKKYKLAVITNIDDSLFSLTEKNLHIKFDWVITSQQVGAYKPSIKIFEHALQEINHLPVKILHIAQSQYHDISPAKSLGITTIWVNRRLGKPGFGATPPAYVKADLEVHDLKKLVPLMGLDTL